MELGVRVALELLELDFEPALVALELVCGLGVDLALGLVKSPDSGSGPWVAGRELGVVGVATILWVSGLSAMDLLLILELFMVEGLVASEGLGARLRSVSIKVWVRLVWPGAGRS